MTPTYDDSGDEPRGPEISERSRGVAVVLGLFGGWLGLHRFYTGRASSAVLMALSLGGLGVWWLYDMVLLVAGEFRPPPPRCASWPRVWRCCGCRWASWPSGWTSRSGCWRSRRSARGCHAASSFSVVPEARGDDAGRGPEGDRGR